MRSPETEGPGLAAVVGNVTRSGDCGLFSTWDEPFWTVTAGTQLEICLLGGFGRFCLSLGLCRLNAFGALGEEADFPTGLCFRNPELAPSWSGVVACTSQARLVLAVLCWNPPFSLPSAGPVTEFLPRASAVFLAPCECLPPVFLLLRFWQLPLLFPRDGCGIASGDICACNLLTQPRRRENSMV